MTFKLNFRFLGGSLVLIATVLYGFLLNNLNLWSDELYSVLMAKDSWGEMWELLLTEDSKPPLYYAYLKVILVLFPKEYEIWAAHFASLLLFIGALVFVLTEVRKDYGDRLSLVMAATFVLMPCSLWLAFEVRTYMLSAFLLFVALIYGIRILDKPKNSDFVKLAFTTVLALYSHYYSLVWLFCLYTGILCCLLREKKLQKSGKKFFLTAGVAFGLFIPWLIVPLTTGGDISKFWYVTKEFVKLSPMFFLNPFEPEILQSVFYMATYFVTTAFSFVVLCGVFSLAHFTTKEKKLFLFAFGTFVATYLILIGLSFVIRPLVTARYLKIFALIWYAAGAVILCNIKTIGKTFIFTAIALFGFSYYDIAEISFDLGIKNAVTQIKTYIPKSYKLMTLDNSNLFCEYYLPEYTCLAIVGEQGEILRKPSVMKNIAYYSDEMQEVNFILSIYNKIDDLDDCLTYTSIYRRGQNIKLCKISKEYSEMLLKNSLEMRLKNIKGVDS
ncbi:MAG: glycosyltransferase family 39 protein [Alphaproteobacteria bacterium]|nr:glycosyltransferase family 39 protein [Alphaproteobacteria bacterium]